MKNGDKYLINELNALHSGVMALEELLVKKKILTLKELNSSVRRAHKECIKNRKEGKKVKV